MFSLLLLILMSDTEAVTPGPRSRAALTLVCVEARLMLGVRVKYYSLSIQQLAPVLRCLVSWAVINKHATPTRWSSS